MKIIFAQGNPGPQYERTRHNVGFRILDYLADSTAALWKEESKFRALVATTTIEGEKALLVKPLSFYNETGQVARALVDFYKLSPEQDVLVIHDELALPFGTVRTREKGSDAGNNGIKSLNSHLGPNYARIRIGVWNELRDRINDADFVLSAFTAKESEQLETIANDLVMPLVHAFVNNSLEPTSVRLHTANSQE